MSDLLTPPVFASKTLSSCLVSGLADRTDHFNQREQHVFAQQPSFKKHFNFDFSVPDSTAHLFIALSVLLCVVLFLLGCCSIWRYRRERELEQI
jgi:hypothetical protein